MNSESSWSIRVPSKNDTNERLKALKAKFELLKTGVGDEKPESSKHEAINSVPTSESQEAVQGSTNANDLIGFGEILQLDKAGMVVLTTLLQGLGVKLDDVKFPRSLASRIKDSIDKTAASISKLDLLTAIANQDTEFLYSTLLAPIEEVIDSANQAEESVADESSAEGADA